MADTPNPPELRFVKRLVTALTVTMIAGLALIVTLLVIRVQTPPPLPLPETLSLPAGVEAKAITVTDDLLVVLTADDRLLTYTRDTGRLLGETRLERDN